MNQSYNSRKRKIYNDYSSVPYEKLMEMVKRSSDFNGDVIEVVKDILRERGASIPGEVREDYSFSSSGSAFTRESGFGQNEISQEVRSFIEKIRQKEPPEIMVIITKYSQFEEEAVEAALIVAVDKGMISFDLKNSLREQIVSNRSKHLKRYGPFEWENNNAFTELVKGYTDDDIYKILEDPSGIVIDVYHAVLLTALSRELISQEDFSDYFENAKTAMRDDNDRDTSIFGDLIKGTNLGEILEESQQDSDDPELVKEKFWKCPRCGESVLMDLTVCWNCETTMPIKIVHPTTEEISKEQIKEAKHLSPWITIPLVIIVLIILFVVEELIHSHPFRDMKFFVIFGIFAIFMAFFSKSKKKY